MVAVTGEESDKTTLVRENDKNTHISNIHKKEKILFAFPAYIFLYQMCLLSYIF